MEDPLINVNLPVVDSFVFDVSLEEMFNSRFNDELMDSMSGAMTKLHY